MLVLAVIFTGLLYLANQRANQSPHTGKTPVTRASPFPTSTVVGSTLPTPATTPIPAPVSSAHNVSVTIADGVAYLSTVYAVRTNDGSLLWNYPIAGSMFAAPILVGNAVYAGATNGMVYALRADNGVILWHFLTEIQA